MDDVTEVCEIVRISLIICSQKCHLNLLKFQKILGVRVKMLSYLIVNKKLLNSKGIFHEKFLTDIY